MFIISSKELKELIDLDNVPKRVRMMEVEKPPEFIGTFADAPKYVRKAVFKELPASIGTSADYFKNLKAAKEAQLEYCDYMAQQRAKLN